MALQVSLSTSSSLRSTSGSGGGSWSLMNHQPVAVNVVTDNRSSRVLGNVSSKSFERRRWTRFCTVKSSLDMAGPVVGQVTEVNKDTFWPLVKAAADKVVVLDMYTQWCGPCKVMAPKFQKLAEQYLDVVFMKLDCNQDNKVVPTFKILKDSKVVKEVTGAKFDDLVGAIETAKSS
ncbi:Thioredoxin [Macleaya cordata]|uniref:Thioredoxin n=1 Tax=Macleaya cordata TaxID=56857 RepID=A0A200PTV9_MACCD|nr:Thioredoxin [Macleaya cordata]